MCDLILTLQECFSQTYLDTDQRIQASFEKCLQNTAARPGWVWG